MKKNKIMIACSLIMIGGLIGCGQKEIMESTESVEVATDVAIENDVNNTDIIETGTPAVTEEDVEPVQYKIYDASEEWNDIDLTLRPIQIDDTVYTVGTTVQEFIEKVEGSEVDYIYEYNPDKLVGSLEVNIISFSRKSEDGGSEVPWFNIRCEKLKGGDGKLSESIVFSIDPLDGLKYTRWFDGRSYDEIISMSYDDVKTMFDSLPCKEGQEWNGLYNAPVYSVRLYEGGSRRLCFIHFTYNDKKWIGAWNQRYEFRINADTSMVESFGLGWGSESKIYAVEEEVQ